MKIVDQDGNKIWDHAIQGGENDWGWALIETFLNELVLFASSTINRKICYN